MWHPSVLLALGLASALAACGGAPTPGPARTGNDCVALFQQYDRALATMSTPTGRADRMVIPPTLQWPVQALQQAGCLTLTSDLTLTAAAGAPITDSGATIPPTSVAAGVVTNTADEVAVMNFFRDHTVPVRSIGRPGLGRRIYLGPFTTQGALDQSRDLAFRAGFASPYPVRSF